MANEFLPFATGVSANVLTPAEYAALTSIVSDGFQSGILTSERLNVVLRQATFVASVMGKIISDSGTDALDNGNISTFQSKFLSAMATAFPSASVTVQGKVELATNAETLTGTDAYRAITPAGLLSLFNGSRQSLAASGFQRLPGGLIIEWGEGITNGSGTANVTFPLTFPTITPRVAITSLVNASQFHNIYGVPTTSWMAVDSWASSTAAPAPSLSFTYIAIGY